MEEGTAKEIFDNPLHPYTKGLMKSVPKLENNKRSRLIPIPGTPPVLVNPPTGCPFYARCPYSMNMCKTHAVDRYKINENHYCRCHLQDPLFADKKEITNE